MSIDVAAHPNHARLLRALLEPADPHARIGDLVPEPVRTMAVECGHIQRLTDGWHLTDAGRDVALALPGPSRSEQAHRSRRDEKAEQAAHDPDGCASCRDGDPDHMRIVIRGQGGELHRAHSDVSFWRDQAQASVRHSRRDRTDAERAVDRVRRLLDHRRKTLRMDDLRAALDPEETTRG